MLILAGGSNTALAKSIAKRLDIVCILANTKKFSDQELKIQINESLVDQEIVIFQSTSNPANDNLVELLLLSDAARHGGAKRIILAIPYFGYSRQDRPSYQNNSISAKLVTSLIQTAGVDQVITLDLHSQQTEDFFQIPIQNLNSLDIFHEFIDKELKNLIIVSPDIGGTSRAKLFADHLGLDLVVINKTRLENGECKTGQIMGEVRAKNCILVDDIIDTGNTICQAADALIGAGALSVTAYVTHGVFSGGCIEMLMKSAIGKLYVTNSIKYDNLPDKIQTIDISGLFALALTPANILEVNEER